MLLLPPWSWGKTGPWKRRSISDSSACRLVSRKKNRVCVLVVLSCVVLRFDKEE